MCTYVQYMYVLQCTYFLKNMTGGSSPPPLFFSFDSRSGNDFFFTNPLLIGLFGGLSKYVVAARFSGPAVENAHTKFGDGTL